MGSTIIGGMSPSATVRQLRVVHLDSSDSHRLARMSQRRLRPCTVDVLGLLALLCAETTVWHVAYDFHIDLVGWRISLCTWAWPRGERHSHRLECSATGRQLRKELT